MDASGSKYAPFRNTEEEAKEFDCILKEEGVVGAQALMREKLKNWQEAEVKIGVTGSPGAGKSSFINAFRGIDDDDERAAKTGIVETQSESVYYSHPDYPKMILVDLPQNSTPSHLDLFQSCDFFFILSATRFRKDDSDTAKNIKLLGKSFFLVRTKVDLDEENETKRKTRDMEDVIKEIRDDCRENLKKDGISINEDEIFLVSNHDREKWDFRLLIDVIMRRLPTLQKEKLTFSVKIKSKKIVSMKVKNWRGWLCIIKFLPAIILFPFDLITFGCISELLSTILLNPIIGFYRSRLGLPEENSEEYKKMKQEFKERMTEFYTKKKKPCQKISSCCCCCCFCCAWCRTGDVLDEILTEIENFSNEILDEAAIGDEEISEEEGRVERTDEIV
ncbi:T-cell-specific guanine nucleotide triphosphate-binding protein 1-like [Dendronephthya gigantea]|uniref:T-cell-specific guanine nucleotide triphosphate-binding protein 1-like n=1 Tax=Dendronephthya gigantea TaxID=151771 RepID=UPI00106B7BA1|nr:T-cell-specific guanine nucleotide triphosphate-binding protein 1-like [Dendronephthya gigantea]